MLFYFAVTNFIGGGEVVVGVFEMLLVYVDMMVVRENVVLGC